MNSPNSALKSRAYRTYLAGATISLNGLWIYRIALGWFTWELTRSELWVGLVAATQFAPAVILGPIFGVLADRLDRRAASILINIASVVNMLVLGLLTSLEFIDIRSLVLLALMQGILDGALAPVRMSIVPNLVSVRQLPNAIALISITFNMSRVIGPSIAGVLIPVLGVAAAFLVSSVCYLGMVVAMCLIRLSQPAKTNVARRQPWVEMVDGARYVFTNTTIRGLLSVTALSAVFGRGVLEMLPVFADDVFNGGPKTLAVLTSSIGAGSILVGLAMSRYSDWVNHQTIRASLLLSGVLVVLLGIFNNFFMAILIVASLGATLSVCDIGSQILLQSGIDD
ncbi:MAG TPA: MFS transporter, partial [Xanthomonadales bacterium]|nr:MFS transporter [Xanthomonadales bacterium]